MNPTLPYSSLPCNRASLGFADPTPSSSRSPWRLSRPHHHDRPLFVPANVHYEPPGRVLATSFGGLGLFTRLIHALGLPRALDRALSLFAVHLPYHESDHVLNIAFSHLTGGHCLDDLQLRRCNPAYLAALNILRLPAPSTSGDFCRRFRPDDVLSLQDAINSIRALVWAQQHPSFFQVAILDADGVFVETDARCKQGVDYSGHKKAWGYHPLLISLANTGEPLFLVNREGNRASHEQAPEYFDKAIDLCRQSGFAQILLRGDTAFDHTHHFDRWVESGVSFVFGYKAYSTLIASAETLEPEQFEPLIRPEHYFLTTSESRGPRDDYKGSIVIERGYENLTTVREEVAEFDYQPGACRQPYRMIVLKKTISVTKGQLWLMDQVRYFFYVTDRRELTASEVVYLANGRCNQENLIEQLKNGVRALTTPVDSLVGNGAYMVMAALAWSLKAWAGLLMETEGFCPSTASSDADAAQEAATAAPTAAATEPTANQRGPARSWARKLIGEARIRLRDRGLGGDALVRMEFKTFLNQIMRIPCQIIKGGRQLRYRLLTESPWLEAIDRLVRRLGQLKVKPIQQE